MLQHVLVGLDGSPLAETILPYVTLLAKGLGADVTLLHVIHLPDELRQQGEHSPALEQALQQTKPQAQAYLNGVEQRLTEAGITARSVVAVGDAASEIVQYAQRAGIDLIALATHGRSGIQRWLYGSVADKVLHTTMTPLLFIRPSDGWVAAPKEIRQIVVPLDGSLLAEAALPMAETLAARFAVPIILLRVVETVFLYADRGVGDYQTIMESLQEAAEDYVHRIAAALQSEGFSVQTVVPVGSPATAIVDYAHEHPGSLVVLTTHGRTGLVGWIVGSVARRVTQQAAVPVLLTRG